MLNIKRFHPGVYIEESLSAMEMSAREFSIRTGISERVLSSITKGKTDISFDVAYKLSQYFGNSITYWTNLQTQYNLYLFNKKNEKEIENEYKLIKPIISYIKNFINISKSDSKEKIVLECRKLIGVSSLSLLDEKDSFACLKEQHTQNKSDFFVQNFWIALALTKARDKNEIVFNKELLIEYIPEIRLMTKQSPKIFFPRLSEILHKCGISFVFLPYLTKSNIYGATKWFSKENVMLAVSNRGGRADLFWFTLFHEISHVLMEHRRKTLINMKGNEDKEADEMAAEMLIKREDWNGFLNKNIFTKESILKFANDININPCIVLGRLHKENKVPYNRYNKCFDVFYDFNNI